MAFSFFNKNTEYKTLVLIVDIGSASVGCALVKIEQGKAPRVLATVREEITFQESLSSAKFLSAMNNALLCSLKKVQLKMKQLNLQLSNNQGGMHIFCTLSSPWFILKSRHICIERKEPFKVSERMLDDFLNEDIEHLKEEVKNILPAKDILIIEKNIIQIKLNGYDIKNPYGQTTSQMEIVMTVGVSSSRIIKSIEQKLGQFFYTSSVRFGTFPVAMFSAVRDIFPNEKNFIFLDITGESTDISFASNDLLESVTAFPRGKNFFIREISNHLHTVHEEASTLFSMFLRKELSIDKHKLVEDIILRGEKEWLTNFKKVIPSLVGDSAIPHKVFFTADADVSVFFLQLLAKTKIEFLPNEFIDAQYIDQFIVSRLVSFETEVLRDPFMTIEALLAEKLISPHN